MSINAPVRERGRHTLGRISVPSIESYSKRSYGKGALAVFLAGIFTYLANGSATQPASDTIPLSYTPYAILVRHTFFLDSFGSLTGSINLHGHVVNKSPIGAAITALPVYIPYALSAKALTATNAALLGKVAGSLMTAIAAALVVYILRELKVNPWLATVLGASLALGTEFAGIASQGLWQQSAASLWLSVFLLTFVRWFMNRSTLWKSALLGFSAAMVVLSRIPDVSLLIIPLAVVAYRSLRGAESGLPTLLFVTIGALPVIIFNLIYDEAVFNSLIATGYSKHLGGLSHQFTNPILQGIEGMLVSGSKGWLIYTPWIAAIPLLYLGAWFRRRQRLARRTTIESENSRDRGRVWSQDQRNIATILGLSSVAYLLLFSKFYQWPGGYVYGPRYELDVSPYLLILLAIGIEALLSFGYRTRFRWVVAAVLGPLMAWSVFTQFLGMYVQAGISWNDSADQTSLESIGRGQLAYYVRSLMADYTQPTPPTAVRASVVVGRPRFVVPSNPFNIRRNGKTVTCFAANQEYLGYLTLRNVGPQSLPAFPGPSGIGNVFVSYHIYQGHDLVTETGRASNLLESLRAHRAETIVVGIDTPDSPGRYDYIFTVLQEGVRWFQSGYGAANAYHLRLTIRPSCPK